MSRNFTNMTYAEMEAEAERQAREGMNDDDNSITENEDDEENPAFGMIDQFCEDIGKSCAEYSETKGNEIYKKRFTAIVSLGSLTSEVESVLKALRDLTNSVGILPNAEMESVMKNFSRTRSFSMLSDLLHECAEGVKEQEDIWNDMVPLSREANHTKEAHPNSVSATRPESAGFEKLKNADNPSTHPNSASLRKR